MDNMTKEQSDDDNSWNAKKEDIDEWFEINPEYLDRKVITDGLFSIDEKVTDSRKMIWASIIGVFADLSDKPTLVVKHEQNERARKKANRSAAAKKGWDTRRASPQWKDWERRKEEGEKFSRDMVRDVTCWKCSELFVHCRCDYFESYQHLEDLFAAEQLRVNG